MLSKSQIDKVGLQLRDAVVNGEPLDVKSLDDYSRTFTEAADLLKSQLNSVQLSDYTERIKSTPSIAAKLSRQRNLRLSQIQDIVGLRFVVDHLTEQDKLVQTLLKLLADTKLKDRRTNPTFGYRAVHLIVQLNGKPIEIQVRTYFQHLWAQFSEMLADREGHALKYGGGDVRIANFMLHLSAQIAERENELLKMGLTLTRQTMEEEVAKHLPPIQAQS